MTTPRAAISTLTAAVLIAVLAACTATPPRPTSTPSVGATATPTAAPTPDALVVPGGARPPAVVDGDWGALITTAALSDAVGSPVETLERRDPRYTVDADNLGATTCDFAGPSVGGRFIVYTADAFDGTATAFDSVPLETGPCVNACEWRFADDDVLAVGYVFPPDIGEEAAAAIGAALGPALADSVRRADAAPWRRDTSGWWPVRDCQEVAGAVSDGSGVALTGTAGQIYTGDIDPETEVPWLAANRTACLLAGPDGDAAAFEVVFTSGTAWNVPAASDGGAEAWDAGVAGIRAFRSPAAGPDGASFQLTDDVNEVRVDFPRSRDDAEAVVRAIAEYAAG